MSLEVPAALIGLLAVPLLLAIEVLARRPRRLVVPSLLLWRRETSIRDASAAVARRSPEPGVLLRLVAVGLAALAAAGPMHRSGGVPPLVVVDASPSMSARTDADRSRLEEARRVALGLAGGAGTLETAGDLAGAAASALASGRTVVVVTDDPAAVPIRDGVRVVGVGGRLENLGITRFDLAPAVGGRALDAFVRVVHRGRRPRPARLRVDGPGLIPVEREVEVPPGGARGVSLRLVPVADDAGAVSRVRASLVTEVGTEDDLAADDAAERVRAAGPTTWRITGAGGAAIRRALRAASEASEVGPEGEVDLLVRMGRAGEGEGRVTVLVSGEPGAGAVGGEVRPAAETGPYGPLSPDSFRVEAARPVQGVPLYLCGEEPVVAWRVLVDGREVVDVGFDLEQGTAWPARVSFPVFWGRVLHRAGTLAGRTWRPVSGLLDEGESTTVGSTEARGMAAGGDAAGGRPLGTWLALGALVLLLADRGRRWLRPRGIGFVVDGRPIEP